MVANWKDVGGKDGDRCLPDSIPEAIIRGGPLMHWLAPTAMGELVNPTLQGQNSCHLRFRADVAGTQDLRMALSDAARSYDIRGTQLLTSRRNSQKIRHIHAACWNLRRVCPAFRFASPSKECTSPSVHPHSPMQASQPQGTTYSIFRLPPTWSRAVRAGAHRWGALFV